MRFYPTASASAIDKQRRSFGSEPAEEATKMDPSGLRVVAIAAEAFGGYGGIAQSTRDLILAVSLMESIVSVDILPRLARDPARELPEKITQHAPRQGRLAYTAAAWRLMGASESPTRTQPRALRAVSADRASWPSPSNSASGVPTASEKMGA